MGARRRRRKRKRRDAERARPRNPLVPVVRRLGHKAVPVKRRYRRHPRHKGRPREEE